MKTSILRSIPALVVLVTAVYAQPSLAAKGSHGGDSVFCAPSSDNPYNGYYSLDYVLADQESPKDIMHYPDSDTALQKIVSRLKEQMPVWAGSLEQFIDLYRRRGNRLSVYWWRPGNNGLIDIHDQDFGALPPENCVKKTEDGDIKVLQTVIRTEEVGQSQMIYDTKLISDLQASTDQLSWIITHEWLWNVTENPRTVKDVNSYLHSISFLSDPAKTLRQVLQINGLGDVNGYEDAVANFPAIHLQDLDPESPIVVRILLQKPNSKGYGGVSVEREAMMLSASGEQQFVGVRDFTLLVKKDEILSGDVLNVSGFTAHWPWGTTSASFEIYQNGKLIPFVDGKTRGNAYIYVRLR